MRTASRLLAPARRLAALGLAIAAFIVLPGANAPVGLGPDSVRSLAEQGGGASSGGGTGGGGSLLSGLGPLLIIGLVVAIIVVIAAAVILARTRGVTTQPAGAEGWWTCANCGAGNLDGAARCHACSTWRTTTSRPASSAQP
jgi:hypothetical protein